jgi:hypothetical protein
LPGLRGFSTTNIKNMRIFYEQWSPKLNRQLTTDDLISRSLLDIYAISRTARSCQARPPLPTSARSCSDHRS